MQILMLTCEFLDLSGKKICSVCDWIVVEHTRNSGDRLEHGGNMCFHLAPVALINVGRQNHQARASQIDRGHSQLYCSRC